MQVHVGARTEAAYGEGKLEGLRFADGSELPVDLIIVAAGIRPRDELARESGLAVGERGGIEVDDALRTSDPHISAIGECALHRGQIHGLVAPGYAMADALAKQLTGHDDGAARFEGADGSTKLKLMGVDVANFGDPFADASVDGARSVVVQDAMAGVYQKVVLDPAGEKVLGGVLVGDASAYPRLLDLARREAALPAPPLELLVGARGGGDDATALDDASQVCSCNDVTKADIVSAIEANELSTIAEVKQCTQAGTGCGGCVPIVTQILNAELAAAGREVNKHICEHFAFTRQELFWIVKLGRIRDVRRACSRSHGKGDGCEVCRPVPSRRSSPRPGTTLVLDHSSIQDTNDRFLANIQRGGTYSVIPRVPGGEITPEKLDRPRRGRRRSTTSTARSPAASASICSARGSSSCPTSGRTSSRPASRAGMPMARRMRTVKSCVGSTWCRYGVQDSVGHRRFAIEERYRGLRAPHKLKSAVSGCIRECAEAQSKDFGDDRHRAPAGTSTCAATAARSPRHADLVATDLGDDDAHPR